MLYQGTTHTTLSELCNSLDENDPSLSDLIATHCLDGHEAISAMCEAEERLARATELGFGTAWAANRRPDRFVVDALKPLHGRVAQATLDDIIADILELGDCATQSLIDLRVEIEAEHIRAHADDVLEVTARGCRDTQIFDCSISNHV